MPSTSSGATTSGFANQQSKAPKGTKSCMCNQWWLRNNNRLTCSCLCLDLFRSNAEKLLPKISHTWNLKLGRMVELRNKIAQLRPLYIQKEHILNKHTTVSLYHLRNSDIQQLRQIRKALVCARFHSSTIHPWTKLDLLFIMFLLGLWFGCFRTGSAVQSASHPILLPVFGRGNQRCLDPFQADAWLKGSSSTNEL